MRRSLILSWLQAHGGQKDMKTEYVDVPNPNYKADDPAQIREPPTIKRRMVIWLSNDGQQLRAFDDNPQENVPDPNQEFTPHDETGRIPGPGVMSQAADPDYEFRDTGKAARDPNEPPPQTPYEAAQQQRALEESQANAGPGGTGNFETNAQRDARVEREAAAERAKRDQQIQEQNVIRQQDIDERAAAQQKEANRLAQERLNQEGTTSAGNLAVSQGNLTLAQTREAREAAAGNRPQFLSTADPNNKNIAAYNPLTGNIDVTANPNYDAIKAEAQRLQQELSIGIQLGDLDQRQAKQQYDQWYQANVTVPFMAAQESRSQAADQRAAQQAEEQRNQFSADFGLRSAQFGQTAGQNAAQNQIALLPYRVGATFGPEMSSAINSLAAGGDVNGPSPSAGIHFSPGAFTYKAPDLQKIAEKATAAALSHLTSYKPGTTPFASAPAAALPNASTFASAPSTKPIVDPAQLGRQYQQLIGPYKPPDEAAPAP